MCYNHKVEHHHRNQKLVSYHHDLSKVLFF
jgi:hypothetical protein